MISIIISSNNESFFSAIQKNINETCGVSFEIIKVENKNQYGICEAYNIGASKSQFENLLFIHEDVLFHTQNWGELLMAHLELENCGVVGVAGSNYVPFAPVAWHENNRKFLFVNQYLNNKEGTDQKLFISNPGFREKVFALDGFLLACKKNVFKQFHFNQNVKGFHGYDFDFSLRVSKQYTNYVVYDILVEHFSHGTPNKEWTDNYIKIKKDLKFDFKTQIDIENEIETFGVFLSYYFKYYKFNVKNVRITRHFLYKKIGLLGYIKILKFYRIHLGNAIFKKQ